MKRRADQIIICFIGYLYVLIMLSLACTLFGGQAPISALLAATAIYPVVTLLLMFRISRIAFFLILGAGAAASGVLCFTGTGGLISVMAENMAEILEKIYYNQEILLTERMTAAATLLVILAAILLSIMVYFLFIRFFSFFLLTGVVLAMHVGVWILTGSERKTLLAFTCMLTVVSYFRLVYEKKAKHGLMAGQASPGSLMLFTLPAVILPVLIVMAVPKSDYPIQWPWLDQKVNQVFQYLEQRFGHTDAEFFSLSVTGLSGSSNRLGGPARPSHSVMLDVRGDRRTYLRGACYSYYDNNMWHQSPQDQENFMEVENTLLENRTGWLYIPADKLFPEAEDEDKELLNSLASGNIHSFLFPTFSLEVRHRNLTTKTVFAPLLTIMPITSGNGGNLEVAQDIHGIAHTRDKLPMGFRYTVYYSQPMYGAPMLKRALTFSYGNLYQDALNEILSERNALTEAEPLKESPILKELEQKAEALTFLLNRSIEIKKEYTRLSEKTPERIKILAQNLTAGCRNDYEKVAAVEAYLKNNYAYTLSPSRVPEGRDFVDWFLFEDKRGYCTYYATSMVVMLRSLGIPARYVEGFVMPENHQDNVYTITGRQAHAWVEVYFQGFGWLTFEPTPVYADVMQYLPSEDNIRRVGENAADIEELMRRYAEMYGKPTAGLPTDTIARPASIDFTPYLKYIPMAMAGLILVLAVANLIVFLSDKLLLLGMDNKGKVLKIYQSMLIWLKHAGYTIRTGESVMEFGRRVDKSFTFSPYTFADASEVFCRVRYGDKEMTGKDLEIIRTIAKQLRKSLLKNFGMRRFLPIRYILFRI